MAQIELNTQPLFHVTEEERLKLISDLGREDREIDYKTFTARPKFIPGVNDRVRFIQGDHIGLGIARSVEEESGRVELYCYYWNDTKEMGYGMHEENVCDFYSYNFALQTVVETRRMNRELNKAGKTWNDKLHRIEPTLGQVEKNQRYWYINDKLKIVQDRERGTPTSHFRFIAGNYFTDFDEALEYLASFNEILRDRLAK